MSVKKASGPSAGVYGGFKPQPSPLMLRHPFAGHALGFDDLVGGHFAFLCGNEQLCLVVT